MKSATRVIAVDPAEPDPVVIREAAEVLRKGGLVAFATETVYGLGADATNPEAVARIFEAKGRPANNPLIVHVNWLRMAESCVTEWPDTARLLAHEFWPGPLTLILPRSGLIPDIVTAGQGTVGLRMPAPDVARQLIDELGRPIAAPSANRSTCVSPTLATHVLDDLEGKVDLILDSGQTEVGLESTVLDLTTRQPRVLRPGPISAFEIQHVLGGLHVHQEFREAAVSESGAFASPGQMAVHYAPRARTVRVSDPADLLRIDWPAKSALVVCGEPELPQFEGESGPAQTFLLPELEMAMRELYVVLRQCDSAREALIVIVPPPDRPEWHALRDRIWRASVEWATG